MSLYLAFALLYNKQWHFQLLLQTLFSIKCTGIILNNVRNHCLVKVLVAKSCPILWDPMSCDPPGSSVHEILQVRILEWADILFSRDLPFGKCVDIFFSFFTLLFHTVMSILVSRALFSFILGLCPAFLQQIWNIYHKQGYIRHWKHNEKQKSCYRELISCGK